MFENQRQRLLFFAITALGISSIATQILMMREFVNVFYGNELVLGIILANWLLLTGVGSYLGKYLDIVKEKILLLIISQVFVALLPLFDIFLIRYLRSEFFLPGQLVDITQIFLSSFVLLLPYCIISGCMLTLACCVFSKRGDAASIGKVYFIDNIGDILGGFLFSFIFIHLFNPFQTAFILMIVNLGAAVLLSKFFNKNFTTISLLLLLFLSIAFLLSTDLEKISTALMFEGQNLVYQEESLYGKLVVTETSGQLNFFENGIPLFSTQNTISNEEAVHYAMVQHDDPKTVLLISGGIAGTTDEILKYGVDRLDYVELDPSIIKIGKRFTTSLEDERVKTISTDGRLFVRQTKNKYDIVIVDLPDPTTAQVNRFYTAEFFDDVKGILNEGGIISISLSSSENYMNMETRKLNSAVYKTLKNAFSNVIIIPGDQNFFIASDAGLSYGIVEKIEQKGIETKYVNRYYLPGKLTEDRIGAVLNSVKERVGLNTDFNPISYYYALLYWLSHFEINFYIPLILLAFLAVFFVKMRTVPFAIFTTGFAASALEVVLLISFQILYGYVYHKVGIIIMMFMVGLGAGSLYMNRTLKKRKTKDLIKIELAIFTYSILLPFILMFLNGLRNEFITLLSSQLIFPIFMVVIAIFVGMEFPLASKLHFRKVASTAGELYSSDLMGACVGAIVVSTFLIPLLGLVNVCLLTGALNLVSAILVWKKPR